MENKLLERLVQYRIDFAYSKQNAYNAYKRTSAKNSKIKSNIHQLNIGSIALSVLTLSSLTVFLSLHTNDTIYIYISTLLSVISLIITVHLLNSSDEMNALPYLIRAEEYSILYKKAKNYEALYSAGKQANLEEIVKHFETEVEKISITPLIFLQEDFEATKGQIKNGDLVYSEDDVKNT